MAGKTVVNKLLESHIVAGSAVTGEPLGIRIDQTLTQDATGTMAYLEFEAMGFSRVKTELSVSYVDHNTVQEGFENADDHRYLRDVARKYGIKFSKPGNGICHQVHLERFGCPGKTLLGSDSHTPTGGGLGMLAIGAGGLDVAVAMGGQPFWLTCPAVVKVELAGELPPWVSAKDIILELLRRLSTKGNVGVVLEYAGEGIKNLSVPERATITNMGAETGVTTSVFPSDEQTRRFLEAQGRGECYRPLEADPDAVYQNVVTIDLASLTPLAAAPHSPGNVVPVGQLKGTPVDQVLIGSCTNASFRDVMLVSRLLEGRKVAPGVSLGVAAGSRQVLGMVTRNGALADIVGAGSRVLESVCGFCIGNSLAPQTDSVSLRTSNRNFYGRSGTESARVYLVSPETAVASALTGTITDPAEFFGDQSFPEINLPERFEIDDSMILEPAGPGEPVEVVRGPNIGPPPIGDPLPEDLEGVVTIRVGDKITTDHIMPAGSRLKYRSNIPRYAEFVFEREDPQFARNAAANRDRGLANVIVAGQSYGQGSSREHAALCPMYLGVKVVIAKSIERIHHSNLINFGIVPAVFENPDDYESLTQGDRLRIAGLRESLRSSSSFTVRNETKEREFTVMVSIAKREREMLRAGGLINTVRGKQQDG